MKIHVICMNDGIEYAIIEDLAKAEKKMKKLKKIYYLRNKHAFSNKKEYNHICYWYIHTVNGE